MNGLTGRSLRTLRSVIVAASRRVLAVALSLCVTLGTMLVPPGGLPQSLLMTPQVASASTFAMTREGVQYWPTSPLNYGISIGVDGHGDQYLVREIDGGASKPSYRLQRTTGGASVWDIPLSFIAPSPRVFCGKKDGVFLTGVKASGVFSLTRIDPATGWTVWERDFTGCETNIPPSMSMDTSGSTLFYCVNVGSFARIYKLDASSGRGPAIVNTGIEAVPSAKQAAQCNIFDIAAEASGTLYAVGHIEGHSTRGFGDMEDYGEFVVLQYDWDGNFRWVRQSYNADSATRNLAAPVAYQVEVDEAGAAYVLIRELNGIGQAGDDRVYWYVKKLAYTGSTAYTERVSRFGGGMSPYQISPDPGTANLAVARGGVAIVACYEAVSIVEDRVFVAPYLYRLDARGLLHSEQTVGPQLYTFEDMTLAPSGLLFLAGTTRGDLDASPSDPPGPYGAYVATYGAQGADSDGDGLLDEWEINGYHGENGGFVDLRAMGADPLHKDIFVQVDSMSGRRRYDDSPVPDTSTIKPTQAIFDPVIKAFADAPVTNPDGTTGVTLHIDAGPGYVMNPKTGATWKTLSRAADITNAYHWTAWQDFNKWKMANFPDERWPIFHYCAFTDKASDNATGSICGMSKGILASDFFVGQSQYDLIGSATFMHELGHNLGLWHGGNADLNFKPNYLSIMNYGYQLSGLTMTAKDASGNLVWSPGHLDYSRFAKDQIAVLKEWYLSESAGFKGTTFPSPIFSQVSTSSWAPNYQIDLFRPDVAPEPTSGLWPIDFNGNGVIDPDRVSANLNWGSGSYKNYSISDTLESFDDWANLNFLGGNIGKTASSLGQDVNTPPDTIDPPIPQAPAYAVTVLGPDPLGLVPGYSSSITFTVRNTGSLADTYTLTANSATGWTTISGIPARVVLAGGASASYTLPTAIPMSTATGAQDVVTLTAASVLHDQITGTGTGIVSASKSLAISPSVIATWTKPTVGIDEGYVYQRYLGWINHELYRWDPAVRDWASIPFSTSPYYVFPGSADFGGTGIGLNIGHGHVIASLANDYSLSYWSPSRLWYVGFVDTHTQILTTASMVATHPVVWTRMSQSGDWAAWGNNWSVGDDSMQEVYSWNLSTNEQKLIARGLYYADGAAPKPADMDGSRFVWYDWTHLLVYDMATSETTTIPIDPTMGALHPVISGDRVAWMDANWAPEHQIHVYDLGTKQGRVIATLPNWNSGATTSAQLDISGDRVMWSEGPVANQDIVVYDVKTDQRLKVATAEAALFNQGTDHYDDGAVLNGDTLVWNVATDTPHGTQYRINYVKLPTGSVAPVTQIAVDPSSPDSGQWYSHEATITFTTDQLGATTFYQWDGTDANSWSTYHGAFPSIEGSHTLHFFSQDAMGNDETPQTVQLRTDTTAPTTVASFDESRVVQGTGVFPAAPAITLTADEPATISFQWDGTDAAGWSTYAGPVTAPEGAHVLYWFSTDLYGNAETVNSRGFTVDSTADATPPTLVLTSTPAPGPGGISTTRPDVTASADETSAIFVRWDSADGVGDGAANPLPSLQPLVPGVPTPACVLGSGWTLYQGRITPPDGAHVLYAYAVDVHGNRSAVTSLTLDVQIPAGVGAPVLGSVDDTTTKAGVPLSFTLQATDPQSLPVTYSAFALPAGASLDPTTGAFVWTPSPDQQGPVFVTFSAGNGQRSDSLTMLITVAGTALNQPPVADGTSVWTYAGAPVAVTLSASDPDGDALTWGASASSSPSHGALSGAAPNLTYTPDAGYTGADSFAFEVSDGRGGTASATGTIDVRALPPQNTAPVFDAVSDKSVQAGSSLSFTLHALDPEGGAVTYGGVLLPAGATIDPATGLFGWTPSSAQVGPHLITVTASDGELVASKTFAIEVTPAPISTLTVTRVTGADALRVALDSSRRTFAAGSVHTVVLASGASWGDALAAAGLAGAYRSPVLLTGRSSLPGGLVTEIRRLGAKHVVIVGSTASVSASVRNKLASSGLSVTRISGADRYEVARNVALRIESVLGHGRVTTVFVVRGDAWFDAMSVSALAYERKAPILFTPPSYLRGVTASAIRTLAVREVIVCGGTEAVQPQTARALDALPSVRTLTRWGGPGRVETSVALTRGALARGWLSLGTVGLTSCYTYSDGLSASSAVGHRGGALLLCGGAGLLDGTRPLLLQHKPEIQTVFVFGRTRVVADSVLTGVSSLLR